LTIAAGFGGAVVVGVGVGFGEVVAGTELVGAVGLPTTTLFSGFDAGAALLVTVLTTVTVRFVVDPEVHPVTTRARTTAVARAGKKAGRRMAPTLGGAAANL